MTTKPLTDLSTRLESIESRLMKLEGSSGYTCAFCGNQKPPNWYVYEIEKEGKWVRPCCAICARENKSRGPYPAMTN